MTNLSIQPVTATIGANVEGVDLREPLPDAARKAILAALLTHHVLFFRNDERILQDHPVNCN